MAASYAEQQADTAVAYTITLLRAAAKESADVLALLEELEGELATLLLTRADFDSTRSRQLNELFFQASAAISTTYAEIADGQQNALEGFAKASAATVARDLNKALGVDVFGNLLSPAVIKQLVNKPIVLGHSAKSWWTGQEEALKNKFIQQMQLGIGLGETNDKLAQRVRGTKEAGYKNGLMQVSRREAVALVRSSAMSVTNNARIETYREHGDLITSIAWLATLDSRTTLICRALDGKAWTLPDYKPIGHDKQFPGPTAHFQCRSTQIAKTPSWSELAGRPIKALDGATLQQAIRDRMKDEGFEPAAIEAAVARARASMDGPIPKSFDMQKWIEEKGGKYAETILGPGRAALFNTGKITVTDLTDQTNRPLTMDELYAFAATGKLPAETEGKGYRPAPGDSKAMLRAKARAAAEAATKAETKLRSDKLEAASPEEAAIDRLAQKYVEAGNATNRFSKDESSRYLKFTPDELARFQRTAAAHRELIAAEQKATAAELIAEAAQTPLPERREPVSKHIITKGKDIEAEVAHALATITRVHDDGGLPALAITQTASHEHDGEYISKGLAAVGIKLSNAAPNKAFAAVHEIGHFLDHQFLGRTQGIWNAENSSNPIYGVLKNSAPAKALQALLNERVKAGKGGEPTKQLKYYVSPQEMFARAYSQWIATKSADPLIVRGWNMHKRASNFGLYWEADEFAPIAAEIEKLFNAKNAL